MAQEIPCDWCKEVAADFMVTLILNGDTIGLGVECVAAWAESITSAMDQAAANEGAPPAPPAPAQVDSGYMEVIPVSDGPDGLQAASEPSDEEWEGDYPQGRPPGPGDTSEAPPEDGGEDSEAGTASHVAG